MRKVNSILKSTLMLLAAVVVLVGTAINAKAEGLADAKPLANGVDSVGRVNDYGDKVYFKYVANASGYVTFSVRKRVLDTEERKWEVSVYDRDAVKVSYTYGVTPCTRPVMVTKGSLYYIQVENDYNTLGKDFLIRANFTAYANVVAEPNNSANNAKNVALGNNYIGVIDNDSDEDFFKITAPDNGYVVMDFSRLTANTTELPVWKFSVYDSQMNELYTIYSKINGDVHNTEGVYYVLKKKQSIYVRVSRDTGSAVGELYSFKTRFKKNKNVEKEANNDYGKANNIKAKTTYLGVMGEPTADYYRFKADSSGKYKVNMKLSKSVTYGYRIKVYDSSKREIATSSKKIYKAGSLKFKAKRGKKYFIVIEHADYSWLFGGRTLGTMYKLKVSK